MTDRSGKRLKARLMVGLSVLAMAAALPEEAAAQIQSFSCPQKLIFGDAIPCGIANTVVITPGNTQTLNGCLATTGAAFSRGRCVVTQQFPIRPIQVSITAPTYVISNGGNNMNVNNFNIMTNAGGRTTTITAVGLVIPIGATLNVGGNQAAGSYSGTFTVNVTLQ